MYEIVVICQVAHLRDIQWVLIREDSFLEGKTISELGLKAETDSFVAGVVRDDKLYPNTNQHFRFQAEDRAAIIGNDSAREKFYQLTLSESGKVEES